MNWADWVILAILVVSSLISLKRGFVKEALSMANWVLAFVVAIFFHEQLAALLEAQITTPSLRQMVAFGLLFAATLIVGAMVNYLLSEVVRMTGLAGTDRMFGMIFGLVRGFVVVMAILIFLPGIVTTVESDPWWRESAFIPHLTEFEDWCIAAGREIVKFIVGLFN